MRYGLAPKISPILRGSHLAENRGFSRLIDRTKKPLGEGAPAYGGRQSTSVQLKKSKSIALIGIIAFVFSLLLVVMAALQRQNTQSTAAATGPLKVNPANPRYFTDGSGKAVYLTGSHTWENLLDRLAKPFDYGAYLNLLQQHNHNFIRLWTQEDPFYNTIPIDPFPWKRTGPGNAADGRLKFDLKTLDQAYFDLVRSRVIQARDRGIYASIMLFEGHALQFDNENIKYHPFHPNNNINNINGDPNGDGKTQETHTLTIPAVTAIQEAYVRKLIDTVNDLDNVLYEITNESSGDYSTAWQYHMINTIKTYEAGKPKQHPVGMTFQYDPGTNAALFNSPADWISPGNEGGDDYFNDPPAADGKKVIISDTDHFASSTFDPIWVWKSFLRGQNPIVMDWYNGEQWTPIRAAMGYSRIYADKMNLVAMTPQGDLSSTGYALANPGVEYLLYQPDSGAFTVNLGSGTYNVEWFNPKTGQSSAAQTVTGGSQTFTPPFSSNAVLYLKNTTITGMPSVQPSSASLAPSPTKVVPTFCCEGHCPTLTPEPSFSGSVSPSPEDSGGGGHDGGGGQNLHMGVVEAPLCNSGLSVQTASKFPLRNWGDKSTVQNREKPLEVNALFIEFRNTTSQDLVGVTGRSGGLQIRPASLPKFVNTTMARFVQCLI
jgi:hypothetical protein